MKIARIWNARASAASVPRYVEYFHDHIVPELRAVPGYEGATVLVRPAADAEITVITRWASLDAIKAFAGETIDAAVVHPAAAALLTDYDRRVEHCDIALEDSA